MNELKLGREKCRASTCSYRSDEDLVVPLTGSKMCEKEGRKFVWNLLSFWYL